MSDAPRDDLVSELRYHEATQFDLRGFTGFAERAEPEEVMVLLRDYHELIGI